MKKRVRAFLKRIGRLARNRIRPNIQTESTHRPGKSPQMLFLLGDDALADLARETASRLKDHLAVELVGEPLLSGGGVAKKVFLHSRTLVVFGWAKSLSVPKPDGVVWVQVVDAPPSTPQEQLRLKRDADFVLCLRSKDVAGLRKVSGTKAVRALDSGVPGPSIALEQCLGELGLLPERTGALLETLKNEGPRLIDVYMTTSRRPEFFEQTWAALLCAQAATKHQIRLNVLVDQLDEATLDVLRPHLDRTSLLSTSQQLGLPFLYNMLLEHQRAVDARTEEFADYICYIQDDCLIARPELYFDFMVTAYEGLLPVDQLGYVSGFYCPIHPGFETVPFRDKQLLLSDSIDGKNFMAPPSLMRQVGPLSWYFSDGERRGNPGPKRGSHFDLWQWKESPQALTKMDRVSIIIPGLCRHLAQSAAASTWGNETSREKQLARREEGRIYDTRGVVPSVDEEQFRVDSAD